MACGGRVAGLRGAAHGQLGQLGLHEIHRGRAAGPPPRPCAAVAHIMHIVALPLGGRRGQGLLRPRRHRARHPALPSNRKFQNSVLKNGPMRAQHSELGALRRRNEPMRAQYSENGILFWAALQALLRVVRGPPRRRRDPLPRQGGRCGVRDDVRGEQARRGCRRGRASRRRRRRRRRGRRRRLYIRLSRCGCLFVL